MLRALARLAIVLLLLAAGLAAARFVVHGPVTPRSLAHSIAFETDSAGILLDYDDCVPAGRPRAWTCMVIDPSGSGGARYRVTVHDGSCWRARRVDSGGYESVMPKRVEGCVHLIQRSLFELL